ncbi:MAG: hypothetical protein PHV74_04175 [Dehalococcoidia bacterium]|nr:hypothetical protein [Dehalococcoidia bacterium]
MQSYDLADFLKLSAVLNYQLSAKRVNWDNIIAIMLPGKSVSSHDQDVLLHVCDYLHQVYGRRKRDLGPFSVLHPLRSTALLSHASKKVELLDLMTCLLHDNFEDVRPSQFKNSNWIKLDKQFQSFLMEIPEGHQMCLREHLQWLTKEPGETYYQYIGRLLDQASNAPEVVRVKLADRLDNTFDMRIDLEDPLQGVDFFENVFQMLYTNTYRGYRPERPHQPTVILNGAQRLYQLFKNIMLMSLIRQKKAATGDPVSQEIFNTLAKASMKEAQRIALHVFGYHETAVSTFRELLMETMTYAQSGNLDVVTPPAAGHRLDGLLMSVFDQPDAKARKKQLTILYKDKPLMIESAVAFVTVFLNFLNDPDYYVRGISAEGVRPESSLCNE